MIISMVKNIDIKGKRNQDKLKSIENPEFISERSKLKKWDKKILDEYSSSNEQIKIIKKLYVDDEKFEHKEIFKKEINNKINGYKKQDNDKECFDVNYFVNYEYVIEKLLESQLKCYYCKKCCLLLYTEVLCRDQWTLDRIDNDYGHNKNNIVISCLDCNIKRKTMNSERFKMGKQLKIIKKIE